MIFRMKKRYSAFLFIFLFSCGAYSSRAQLIGGNAYLQGQWLEIGELNNGAFGAYPAPAGYHNSCASCCNTTALAEVYNWTHTGWGASATTFFGDYTFPGTPFEGWELQIAGTRYQAMQGNYSFCTSPGTYSPAAGITGSVTSYTNTGGSAIGNWVGSCAGLNIFQETRVDTFSSWVVVTARFYNISGGPLSNIYYMRTTDPDNEHEQSGSFTTTNTVIKQNDADHRVLVNSKGTTYSNAYLALGAKDCRAKCLWYSSWPTSISADLATAWSSGTGMGTSGTTVGSTTTNDWAIGIIFNVGTLATNDSAVISYAYIFDNDNGIDSAFPEPAVSIAGRAIVPPPAPYPNIVIDTYDACANPGLTAVPVDLVYAEDKSWTWSTWSWSPATGLSATTGAHIIVYSTVLPPVITYTVTGYNPAECDTEMMFLTFITCNNVRANSPCFGDTLFLKRVGDSTGCTYYWYGPPGYSSTMQNPFIFPATYADSTKFFVVRTLLGVHDTDSIAVTVHVKPVLTATNNSPLCKDIADTLRLHAYPTPAMSGMRYAWTGPSGFTSTLQHPTLGEDGLAPWGFVGNYQVIVTTIWGCKDTALTHADTVKQPDAPRVTADSICQGMPFGGYRITGLSRPPSPWGHINWYPSLTGGTPDSVTAWIAVNTAVPGRYKNYFTQQIGSCESKRDSISVRVTTTPAAPLVVGPMEYCQYIGPIVTLNVVPPTASSKAWWYLTATGGPGDTTEPLPSVSVSGIYPYWVSIKDTGCEGPRTHVTITVHPKPNPPIPHPEQICQYFLPHPVSATQSPPGLTADTLKWYGPGVTPPNAPYPPTSVAPDTILYFVTQTTPYGCVSNPATDTIIIKAKPQPPLTGSTRYCQHDPNTRPLNELVDSALTSQHLNWYYNSIALPPIPHPFTDTVPGVYNWWVSQTINGCEGDSAAVPVTILYKPVFDIAASSPWVCQYDSISLAYKGPILTDPGYLWTIPKGSFTEMHTHLNDSLIVVEFDSATQGEYVYLQTSDYSGFCFSQDTIRIKVVPIPTMMAYTKPDVCLGDTVQLALASRAADAYDYKWWVDSVDMNSSPIISIISANSNSGGPFVISWLDSGKHTIRVTTTTVEGCKSYPTYDSVYVHTAPDARFGISALNSPRLCIEDSVQFTANLVNYNYSYQWTPLHDFNNLNQPMIWGKMDAAKNIITLTVTDPYGCYATQSLQVDADGCCALFFPNAFTPNGDGNNDYFEVLPGKTKTDPNGYAGYHRFHMFRIVNRWGQTIFESANSADAKWDGNFNGVPQEMGVYYWYVKYDCAGKTIEEKGDVTLIR
jgi:gliding motility-associated-like protein